jgi:hypothetical protein
MEPRRGERWLAWGSAPAAEISILMPASLQKRLIRARGLLRFSITWSCILGFLLYFFRELRPSSRCCFSLIS